jgi:hypothetical protein
MKGMGQGWGGVGDAVSKMGEGVNVRLSSAMA